MKPEGIVEHKGNDDILTEKQCQVLDLLIEHKTSKEIARELGISPHTVDQRISLARGRLGVSSRNELAARYREIRKTTGQTPLAILHDSDEEQSEAIFASDGYRPRGRGQHEDPTHLQERQHDDGLTTAAVSRHQKTLFPTSGNLDHRVGPEVFEGSSGGLWRSGAIVVTALLLVVTVLVLLAVYDQLSDMLA